MAKKHNRKTITIIVIVIIVLLIGFLIWGFVSNWKFFGKDDKNDKNIYGRCKKYDYKKIG